MMGIKKVVAWSRNRKREKKMNATTQAKTRNVYVRDIMMPVVFCKDCKYCDRHHLVDGLFCYRLYEKYNEEYPQMIIEVDTDDFCSRGKKKDE